jgi:predicted nucleotidyltransferase
MNRNEVLAVLKTHRDELRERSGVRSIRLFGSVARGGNNAASDIDVLVDFGGPAGFAQYMDPAVPPRGSSRGEG